MGISETELDIRWRPTLHEISHRQSSPSYTMADFFCQRQKRVNCDPKMKTSSSGNLTPQRKFGTHLISLELSEIESWNFTGTWAE